MGEGVSMNIVEAYDYFRTTESWKYFSAQTKRQYGYLIEHTLEYKYKGADLAYLSIEELDKDWAEWLFRKVSAKGTTVAQQTRTAYNAMLREVGVDSPFHAAALKAAGKKVCREKDIIKLLDTAYNSFNYRNIGIIIQLVYATGQAAGTIAQLTWDDVDFMEMELDVGGRRVPYGADIQQLLTSQQKDFGFQKYVAPSPFPTKQGYVAYGDTQFSRTLGKLKKEAGFKPLDRINIGEIRRAGLIARVSMGSSRDEIKSLAEDASTHMLLSIEKDAGVDNSTA
jgi:integrase